MFNAIFSTGPAVALIITLILDNTVPGTREERGLHVWQQLEKEDEDWWEDDYANRVSRLRMTPEHALCSIMLLPHAAVISLCSRRMTI